MFKLVYLYRNSNISVLWYIITLSFILSGRNSIAQHIPISIQRILQDVAYEVKNDDIILRPDEGIYMAMRTLDKNSYQAFYEEINEYMIEEEYKRVQRYDKNTTDNPDTRRQENLTILHNSRKLKKVPFDGYRYENSGYPFKNDKIYLLRLSTNSDCQRDKYIVSAICNEQKCYSCILLMLMSNYSNKGIIDEGHLKELQLTETETDKGKVNTYYADIGSVILYMNLLLPYHKQKICCD